jgi:hypothetical protein
VGETSSYRFLTSFYNADIPDALYDLSDNCCNKDVSLSYKLWLLHCVRHSLIVSSTTLIVVDNRSSSHESPPGTGPQVSEMRVRPGPMPLNQMEMTVRTEAGQYPTLQMSRCGSSISTDQQGNYKAHEVSFNVDVESGPEK